MERTAYINYLLTKGSQAAIANQLIIGCQNQNPQAFAIVDATDDKTYNRETFLKAAKLILESK